MKTPISDVDFLRCEGRSILNKNSQKVFLRGTNLGSWLLQEVWQSALEGVDSQWELVTTLEKRFGRERAATLIKTFEDNFITEYDLDYLESLGFTCLRLPFWYRNLYNDDEMTVKEGLPNFERLDFIVSECQKRGMYVIIDMHGVPGFQSIAHHCCRTNHCELYDENERGEHFRQLGVRLWREIAEHYKGNPTVAAFDLMNEPMCDYKGEQKVNKKYWDVYNLFYKAVREVDPDRIITLEAIWTPNDMPDPSVYGWENVIYQYHLYDSCNLDYSSFVPRERLKRFNVPVLIGEFSPCRGTASWEHILKVFNRAEYHWLSWTYKGYCRSGSSEWFMLGRNEEDLIVDINTAEYDEILTKWSAPMRSENGFVQMNDNKLLGKYASMKG